MTPQQIAADYGYNVEALRYQRDRRSAGSYTTTLAGSADEYGLYFKAWSIAVTREYEESQSQLIEARLST